MIEMQRTVQTTSSPVAVFDYLADFTNAAQWDPNTIDVARVHGDGAIGTEYRVTSTFAGRTTELNYQLTDLESHSLIRFRAGKKSVTAVDTLLIHGVDSVDGGTAVTYLVEFNFHGLLGLVEVLLKPAVRRLLDEGADSLRTELQKLPG